jgi:Crp-like helix-turn-helix domain
MGSKLDKTLLPTAFRRFQDLLQVEGVRVVRDELRGDGRNDDVWRVETGQLFSELAVQAYAQFTPRAVDQLLGGLTRLMRSLRDQPILVVAPWFSPRSRELLTEQGINYLDLTGNIHIRVPRLPIVVRTDGAQKDPTPTRSPRRGLQGKAVNALVRALVDFTPPYRMSDLAKASGLSLAYVSRTLDALDDERLIERDKSRTVVAVDWERLLRYRSETYSLIKSNGGRGYVTRTGLTALTESISASGENPDYADADADAAYRRLVERGEDQALVTGSFAVRRYVQISAPVQLALYVPDMTQFAERYGLMATERGANVLLLQAAHHSQLQGIRLIDGVFHAGLSQLVQDCLGGNGRLPAEGDALLEWMGQHEADWRKAPQWNH